MTKSNMVKNDDIYKEIGVKTLINCRGTWTYLGGALINPVVRRAMERASKHTVEVLDLQRAVGERIAKLAGTEAAMVTCGAAAAISAGTAGCMAGTDPDKIFQLPDTKGMKNEVILQRRSVWDISIRLTGAKLILADTIEKLQNSINENTVMIYWSKGGYSVEEALSISKKAGVPLFVDVASAIPCRDPYDVLTKYAKMGVDLYTFSGGKGLLGPQTSGLLLGRADLIEAALANYSPWEGSICRPMKAGKEEIIGALIALETYMKRDHEKDWLHWENISKKIAEKINGIPGVKATVEVPTSNYPVPHCIVEWNELDLTFTTADCLKELKDGNPPIEVQSMINPSLVKARVLIEQPKTHYKEEGIGWIGVCPIMLKPGEEEIVIKRISEIFDKKM